MRNKAEAEHGEKSPAAAAAGEAGDRGTGSETDWLAVAWNAGEVEGGMSW